MHLPNQIPDGVHLHRHTCSPKTTVATKHVQPGVSQTTLHSVWWGPLCLGQPPFWKDSSLLNFFLSSYNPSFPFLLHFFFYSLAICFPTLPCKFVLSLALLTYTWWGQNVYLFILWSLHSSLACTACIFHAMQLLHCPLLFFQLPHSHPPAFCLPCPWTSQWRAYTRYQTSVTFSTPYTLCPAHITLPRNHWPDNR